METKKMIKEQEVAKKTLVEKEIKKEIIHYKDFTDYAICGVKISAENLTRDSEKVTCKNCMRTRYWKEYIIKK